MSTFASRSSVPPTPRRVGQSAAASRLADLTIEPQGARVEVSQIHMFRYSGDPLADLWHVWDTTALLRQLGAPMPEMRVG